MDWTVSRDQDGTSVRDFIKQSISLSSKMLKFLKYREDGILVNGERVTVRRILRAGDILTLSVPDSESAEELLPVDLSLTILYEDEELVVPSKPHGMPTHPSHNHHNDTVANALAYRYAKMGVPFVFRPINRLDRDTSGLLIVARNKLAAGRLTKSMQEGDIQKCYLAILEGELEQDRGVIEKPLHRTAQSVIVREVCSPETPDAEWAKTEFTVLARENRHTLVLASPITGRTHQLRVHFASMGCPILGDTLYGKDSPLICRQALHAYRITFPHPSDGHKVSLSASLPGDMQRVLAHLFPSYTQRKEEQI